MTRPQVRFLPGIETASGVNRALVTHPELTRGIDFGGHDPTDQQREAAQIDLARKRQLARTYGSVALAGREAVTEGSFRSWDELAHGAVRWMAGHLDRLDWQELSQRTGRVPADLRAGTEGAMRDGIATVAAIQEVVPRVLAHRRFEDPDSDIAHPWIARTKGLAMEWMGVHHETDFRLAEALTRFAVPEFSVFAGLRLEPGYFIVDDAEQRVVLEPLAIHFLRARDGRPPDADHLPGEALFGCPGRMLIPALYDAMTAGAAVNGLIGQSYWNERAKLGYVDAAEYR